MKNQYFFFELIPCYIIILMPAFLISGPFLSDLGVSIVALTFIINSVKNRLTRFYNNIYFKVFFIFCIMLIISSLSSNNVLISLKNSFFYFRFGIFSLCFWYLLEKDKFLLRNIFYSLVVCFSSLILDGYIQYLSGKNLFGYPLYNEYRVSSFFGSELILGSYLSRFFPILFGLFIFVDQIKKNKLLLCFVTLIFILAEGLIFLSGERLALFFMNLSAIFIILMIKHYRVYRFWTYVSSIALIILLFNLFPSSKERFLDQTIHDFTRNTEDTLYIFSKPHNDMYITAYRLFLDNKYLGVGPRQFRKECDKYAVSEYSCETHPHNTYMELLSEAGIFSFSIIFFIFLLICYYSIKHILLKLVKNKKNYYFNDLEICLLSAILISLWPFSPSGSFFNNWMSIVYYFPIGIFLWQRSLNVKSHNVSKIQEN